MIIHHVNLGNHFKSPVQFFFRPSPRVETFFLEVFATLAHKCSKTHGKEKFHPMSLVQLLLRPSPWVVFLFSRGFCNLGPKMPQNQWKNKKTKKIRPHRFGGEGVLIGGQNSNTKCSMTFVNIAVAISALAGGGQKRFRTEPRIRWCFRHFSRIFGCLSARGY